MVDFIMWIVIGVVAGWLAGLITKDDHSIVGDLILGLLGALVAGFVVGQIGPESNSILFSIIAATIGAVVLVLLKNMLFGSRGRA
jgi:uncharacterized membrane protein YeaQ/YmgE (transglycosylase-associated protein family)